MFPDHQVETLSGDPRWTPQVESPGSATDPDTEVGSFLRKWVELRDQQSLSVCQVQCSLQIAGPLSQMFIPVLSPGVSLMTSGLWSRCMLS